MAEKRPIEATQNGDSFAVCNKCQRVSNTLDSCDKCGNTLTEDNSAQCFSSDPKRARLDTTTESSGSQARQSPSAQAASVATPPLLTNGTAAVSGAASTPPASVTGAAMNPVAASQPVPQQLYMNTQNTGLGAAPGMPSTAPPGLPPPRPQQMFVNLNNQVVNSPLGAIVSSQNQVSLTNGTSGLRTPHAGLSPGIAQPSQTPPGAPPMSMPLQQRPVAAQPGMLSPSAQGSTALAAAGLATSVPTSQAQPPPAHQNAASRAARPADAQQQNSQKFYIHVKQIRIGLRGFSPSSTVQFKDDGVLFTLQEYPNAPLLLNIRAIMKCRANLAGPVQALFFYLESSCIKQIRTIFHMRDHEFNEKSTIDKVKCVAVFPTQISPREGKMITDIFQTMKISSRRNEDILEIITPEQVLDTLYGTHQEVEAISRDQRAAGVNNNVNTSMNNVSRTSTASSVAAGYTHNAPSRMPAASDNIRLAAEAQAQQQRAVLQAQQQQRLERAPRPNPALLAGAMGSLRVPGPPSHPNMPQVNAMNTRHPRTALPPGQQAPTLVIPQDTARWNAMKKTLMVGGVYQVQMQDGRRKYCLWNGNDLLPCLVQDQEVVLKCTHLRIGSLKAPAAGDVRVQNDNNNRGISFKLTLDRRTVELNIPQTGITDVFLSADPRYQALYIYTTGNTAINLCRQCGMVANKDPFYSSQARHERQRHLILFLKDVNQEQKDALLAMKYNITPPRRFIQEIPLTKTLEILSAIKSDSFVQSTMDDHFGANRPKPKATVNELDSLVRFVSGREEEEAGGDDDDVVMTQEEVGTKCPYTQKIMQEPVQNIRCQHNYEKAAILEFIQRKKAKNIEAKCPYAGCGNQTPLVINELKANSGLKKYIQEQIAAGKLS